MRHKGGRPIRYPGELLGEKLIEPGTIFETFHN